MLSKIFRLPAKEIPRVLRMGKRQNYRYYSVCSLSSEKPQAAVIVSSKIDKKATVRNKIKRRIKEAFQKNIEKFKKTKIIFFAKKEIVEAPFSEILAEINKISL